MSRRERECDKQGGLEQDCCNDHGNLLRVVLRLLQPPPIARHPATQEGGPALRAPFKSNVRASPCQGKAGTGRLIIFLPGHVKKDVITEKIWYKLK
jgi:hypothetical protein